MAGCTIKLTHMSNVQGGASMGCDEVKTKMRLTGADERRFVVYGCGEYEVWEGSCNGETNGCDNRSMASGCDGSCRVRRTSKGELTESGEIPEWVLKNEDPPV